VGHRYSDGVRVIGAYGCGVRRFLKAFPAGR